MLQRIPLALLVLSVLAAPVRAQDANIPIEEACEAGDLYACVGWGVILETGDFGIQDVDRARELYRRACDGGAPRGCTNLGSLHQNGIGVPADLDRAIELYRKACVDGDPIACGLHAEIVGGDPIREVTDPDEPSPNEPAPAQPASPPPAVGSGDPASDTDAAETVIPGPGQALALIEDERSGAPLERFLVELPDLGVRGVTDADGRVVLGEIPEGTHRVRAEGLGYERVEGQLTIPGNETFRIALRRILDAGLEAPGRIQGRVTDDEGDPLPAVDIVIAGSDSTRVVTDDEGRFAVERLAPGLTELHFSRLGLAARETALVLQPGSSADIAVTLTPEAIDLAPAEVTATRLSRFLANVGYYERAVSGVGHRFVRQEIERLAPSQNSQLLRRVPSLHIEQDLGNLRQEAYAYNLRSMSFGRANDGRYCKLDLYIDNNRMFDGDLNTIDPEELEAVEVYMGGSVPIQFVGQNNCGVILYWTIQR